VTSLEVVPKYKEDFIFMIIDEGGIVVYSYPKLGDKSRILSALIHAVSEISRVVGENSNEIIFNFGNKKAVITKKKGYSFVMIYSEELDKHDIREIFDDLVNGIVSVLSANTLFPDDIRPLITSVIVDKLTEIISKSATIRDLNEYTIVVPTIKSCKLIHVLGNLIGDDKCIKIFSKLDGRRTLMDIILAENLDEERTFSCVRKMLEKGVVKPINKRVLFARIALEYANLIIDLLLHLIDKEALMYRIKDMIKSQLIILDEESMRITSPLIDNVVMYSAILLESNYYTRVKEIWKESRSLLNQLILLSVELFTIEGAVKVVETINEDLRERYGSIFNDFLEESGIYESLKIGEEKWKRNMLF